MDTKPIPAFYCCYLLRSTVQRSFNYIGSTPNMLRRVRQHNGESKGGAKRTSRNTLKPWEVTCIVHGFPSKIAALQFEWAWQHTHKSRHAKDDNEGLLGNLDFRVSPKSGKVRKRKPSAQARSLTDRITNLHILLRARSFGRWPLSVRFFAVDVFRVWKAVDEKMEAGLRSEIEVCVDENAVEHYDKAASTAPASAQPNGGEQLPLKGVENLDFGYTNMKGHIEKSRSILAGTENTCSVCTNRFRPKEELLLVCEHEHCNAVSHMACLSKHFTQSGADETESLIPLHGSCPSCKQPSKWQTLVKELSLRTRGEKELAKIFKKPRARKNAAGAKVSEPEEEIMTAEELEESEDDEFIELEEFEAQVMKEALQEKPKPPSGRKTKGSDGFIELEDFEAQIIERAFQRRPTSLSRPKVKAGTKGKA